MKGLLVVLIGWSVWVAFWAWNLPFNAAPDECLHFESARFFAQEKRLPVFGQEPTSFIDRDGCFGITYLSTPFVHYILAGFLINNGNYLGVERSYLAARLSSLFFGVIFVICFYKFLRLIFQKNGKLVWTTLLTTIFIPQVTYIFSYLNHEAYSLAVSAFLFWVSFEWFTDDSKKKLINFFVLGLAIAFQFWAKSNFYLVLILPLSLLGFELVKRKNLSFKGLVMTVTIILTFNGWFWGRNYLLYKDPLGVMTAQELVHQRMVKRTYAQAGWSGYDILFKSKWLEETTSSFYGRFGYMTVEIDPAMQWFFRLFIFGGITGNLYFVVKNKVRLFTWARLFEWSCWLIIVLVPILSLLNTLYFDFQNQGRYLFPALIPLLVFTNRGLFKLVASKDDQLKLTMVLILGSLGLNFWSFLYLPKIMVVQ